MGPRATGAPMWRVARGAVTAGLGAALAIGAIVAPARPARAETGSVTIEQRSNEGATYDAYQVFSADINDQDIATHVTWASEQVKTVVLAFLDANGYGAWLAAAHPGDGQHDGAQNAAEYIAHMIESSKTADTGDAAAPADPVESQGTALPVEAVTARTTAGLTFANEIAQALASSGLDHKVIPAGTATELDEGLWLIVTTDSTTEAHGEAGTAPLWLPVGGSVSSIHEKSSVPTIDKQVLEDSTSKWGKVADADLGQRISYRLVGTLPANYEAFDSYHYVFTDTLSEGLSIDIPAGKTIADAITVSIDGRKVPVDGASLRATYENNVLTAEFPDLKAQELAPYAASRASTITVEYTAHLNGKAAMGSKGNPNTAHLTYTDDPNTNHDGRTEDVTNKVFTYQLRVAKVARGTSSPLAGAKFTLRVSEKSSDAESRGKYVQPDGSLTKEAHEYTTDGGGAFSVTRIDEGTYVLTETAAPSGYQKLPGEVEVAIGSTLRGDDLSLVSLTATSSSPTTTIQAVTAEDGLARLSVADEPVGGTPGKTTERLAQTGVGPIGLALVAAGGAVIAVTLLRRRRDGATDEQQ